MTVTTVAGTSGGAGIYLSRMLAAHAGTSQSILLHPAAGTIPFSPPANLRVVAVDGSGAAYDAAVMRALRGLDKELAFVELPVDHPCSTGIAAVSDLILVPMAPGQVSVTEGLRALAAIERARKALPEVQLHVIGWDSVGGPAANDRLIAAAKRAVGRDPDLEVDIKGYLSPWSLPPLHWSEIDYILGLADRPANSRVDEVLQVLRGLWMAMQHEPLETIQQVLSERLADLAAGEPHSDGTRMALLSHDLHMIDAGLAPSSADLRHAPQLSPWRIEPIISSAMRGSVVRHPLLDTKRDIVTSPIMRVDPNGMWCRSTSRFYGLGRREATGADLGLANVFFRPGTPDRGQPH